MFILHTVTLYKACYPGARGVSQTQPHANAVLISPINAREKPFGTQGSCNLCKVACIAGKEGGRGEKFPLLSFLPLSPSLFSSPLPFPFPPPFYTCHAGYSANVKPNADLFIHLSSTYYNPKFSSEFNQNIWKSECKMFIFCSFANRKKKHFLQDKLFYNLPGSHCLKS